jgi:hypothetical protein
MKEKDNKIINDLQRLCRIGEENSKTVQKIKESCQNVGKYIAENDLVHFLQGYKRYGDTLINSRGEPIGTNLSRGTALDFAKDVYESGVTLEVFSEGKKR